jgi:Zn-dependent protease
LGIPLGIHSSWPLIAALVAFSLAMEYFPAEYPGWAPELYWITAVVTTILFFASVVTHELRQSIVALREGLPVRSITLFIFGGLAQIGREPSTAATELRIAAAPMLAASGTYLSRINFMLAVFNLLPGFPLDGGRILRAALWATTGNFPRWGRDWHSRSSSWVAGRSSGATR